MDTRYKHDVYVKSKWRRDPIGCCQSRIKILQVQAIYKNSLCIRGACKDTRYAGASNGRFARLEYIISGGLFPIDKDCRCESNIMLDYQLAALGVAMIELIATLMIATLSSASFARPVSASTEQKACHLPEEPWPGPSCLL